MRQMMSPDNSSDMSQAFKTLQTQNLKKDKAP